MSLKFLRNTGFIFLISLLFLFNSFALAEEETAEPAATRGRGAASSKTPEQLRRERLEGLRAKRGGMTEQERLFRIQNRIVTIQLKNNRRISAYLLFDNTLGLPQEDYVGIRIPGFGTTGIFAGIFVYPKKEIAAVEYYDSEKFQMRRYTLDEYYNSGRAEIKAAEPSPESSDEEFDFPPPLPAAGDLININTASNAELQTLPRVGAALAGRIIEYRDENGPFAAIEDLKNVRGIGDALFEGIKDQISAD